jgi:hypothetical protein
MHTKSAFSCILIAAVHAHLCDFPQCGAGVTPYNVSARGVLETVEGVEQGPNLLGLSACRYKVRATLLIKLLALYTYSYVSDGAAIALVCFLTICRMALLSMWTAQLLTAPKQL